MKMKKIIPILASALLLLTGCSSKNAKTENHSYRQIDMGEAEKMMKEETFDYSKVPLNFGLCATDTCPYTDTCLRRDCIYVCTLKQHLPICTESESNRVHSGKMQVLLLE